MWVSCQKKWGFTIITTNRNANEHFLVRETYPVCDPTVLVMFLVMFWRMINQWLAENGEREHIEAELKAVSARHLERSEILSFCIGKIMVSPHLPTRDRPWPASGSGGKPRHVAGMKWAPRISAGSGGLLATTTPNIAKMRWRWSQKPADQGLPWPCPQTSGGCGGSGFISGCQCWQGVFPILRYTVWGLESEAQQTMYIYILTLNCYPNSGAFTFDPWIVSWIAGAHLVKARFLGQKLLKGLKCTWLCSFLNTWHFPVPFFFSE